MELIKVYLPVVNHRTLTKERVWCGKTSASTARVYSVVRHATPIQFCDVIAIDCDASGVWRCTGQLEPAGYALHVVSSPRMTSAQAEALTQSTREAGLRIEVWSLTMEPPLPDEPRPMVAGLATEGSVAQCRKAAGVLRRVAVDLGVTLVAETLQRAAGDEVGEMRDKRLAERFALATC